VSAEGDPHRGRRCRDHLAAGLGHGSLADL